MHLLKRQLEIANVALVLANGMSLQRLFVNGQVSRCGFIILKIKIIYFIYPFFIISLKDLQKPSKMNFQFSINYVFNECS